MPRGVYRRGIGRPPSTEAERRRGLIERLVVQGLTTSEIKVALERAAAQGQIQLVSVRMIQKDLHIIREQRLKRVQKLTADEVAAELLAHMREEGRRLWELVRETADMKTEDKRKLAGIRLGALNSLRALRDSTVRDLERLGVIPEVPTSDLLRVILALDDTQLRRLAAARDEELGGLLEGRALRLMRGRP